MNVALPSVYRFLGRVLDDFIALYKEAGVPFTMVHVGGDELPAGVWEKSPIAQELIAREPGLHKTEDLWYYYYEKVNQLLKERGLQAYGWEEAGMRKTMLDGKPHYIPNPDFAKGFFSLMYGIICWAGAPKIWPTGWPMPVTRSCFRR